MKIFSNHPFFKSKGILFLIPVVLAFSIYYITLLHEILSGDSAEFALQAYNVGVTHSPGYPVYILLGKLFILLFSDPGFSTNLLSAVCTSLSIGIMSLLIFDFTKNRTVSIIIPLFFAFSPIIWPLAISTEVYNVNMLFLSLSIYVQLLWYRKPSNLMLLIAAFLFGMSLGTYLANLLLLPAFLFIIFIRKENRKQNIAIFISVTIILGILILAFSILRSNVAPPLAKLNLPNTVIGSIKYFTGYEDGTMRIHSVKFYLLRILEHSEIFINNFNGIGVLFGLIGVYKQFRINRNIAIFFILIVIIDLGYFTSYEASGYYLMVTPSYFIFYIWTAYGFSLFYNNSSKLKPALITVLILISIIQVLDQMPEKLARAKSHYVTNFAIETLKKMPSNAIIFCGWGKYTTFLYFQRTQNLRRDITVMLPVTQNYYRDGKKFGNYFTIINANINTRPIFVDVIEPKLWQQYEISVFDNNWYKIKVKKSN